MINRIMYTTTMHFLYHLIILTLDFTVLHTQYQPCVSSISLVAKRIKKKQTHTVVIANFSNSIQLLKSTSSSCF